MKVEVKISKKIIARCKLNQGKSRHSDLHLFTGTARKFVLLVLLLSAAYPSGRAADIVFLKKAGSDAALENQIRNASGFYGLDVETVSVVPPGDSKSIAKTLFESHALAIIISANALGYLDRALTLAALRRVDGTRVALLIVAAESSNSSQDFVKWSDGRIEACRAIEKLSSKPQLVFADNTDLARPLGNVDIRSASAVACGFVLSHDPSTRILAQMRGEDAKVPVFVEFSIDTQPVFAVAAMGPTSNAERRGAIPLPEAFSNIAGLLVFLRNAAGERAWHAPAYYANLTIDDPWLTEPYGNLEYGALLREMDKHNFHTTIAFVPWNFDRSEPNVVSLFHDRPDRFSISIHGNNHNHREFGDYATQPYERQKEDIQQALARMEKFKKITGLSYDRVMVFPHAVAPEETLKTLKSYGYWATVNSENVPLGSSAPDDPLFALNPWTLAFDGFPSVKRVSAEVPVSTTNIAINAFLGNPQLFYVHHEIFQNTIEAFNLTADEINRREPYVQWRSLGYIVRHYYLIRSRPDHDYDIRAFSSNFELSNPGEQRVVFHVLKAGDSKIQPHSVTVNGKPTSYQADLSGVHLDVTLEPKQIGNVEISYSGGLDLNSVSIAKTSHLVAVDRHLSDFRDLTMSKSSFGRKVQSIYYKYGIDGIERSAERSLAFFIAVIIGFILWRIAVTRRKRINIL